MLFLSGKSPLKRLYRISLKSALVICIPIGIFIGWMVVDAYVEYRRFSDIACRGKSPAFNIDIMHLFLRNYLRKALVHATAPEMPNHDKLPLLQMSIDREHLAALNKDLPQSGKANDYRAYVKYKGKSHTVKARYMGDNHWHWLYDQKSWRIKTKRSKLIEGSRKLNIKNPRTRISINECISNDLAKEIGLLAPRVFPVKLMVNNIYKGVHLFWDPVDESVIRRFNKMPGSVYSGDGAPADPISGVSLLWKDEKWWQKSASRNSEQKDYRDDIKALISAVNDPDLKRFYGFANQHLDKDAYASYLSLDNLTACMHHDYNHNHKFYFDPIMGKFQPVSWDIGDWHLTNPRFDAASNPLLDKWKRIPAFDLIRQRRLYELIGSGVFSADSIRDRVEAYAKRIRPALAADVYRDEEDWRAVAVMKFPTLPCFPFLMRDWESSVDGVKEQITKRVSVLREYLRQSGMTYNLSGPRDNGKYVLSIAAHGNVGRRITGMRLRGAAERVSIFRDMNRDFVLDAGDLLIKRSGPIDGERLINIQEDVLPGYKKAGQTEGLNTYLFGNHRLDVSPLDYPYIIVMENGTLDAVQIESQNLVTGEPMKSKPGVIPSDRIKETISLHPWDLPSKAAEESVVLGPGKVTISETKTYPEHISLRILPGTTLRLGEGVSIFCYGKVTAKGTRDRPIRFEPIDVEKPWGVFALQGNGSSGSVFEECIWQGGSEAHKDLIYYCGMVSMHGVDDLTLRSCSIGRNYLGDDAMHLAYCKGFTISGCRFDQARSDALDVDISEGKILLSRFLNSGNDTLDLMTSVVQVRNSLFENAGDKGISVGEKSDLVVDGSVFSRCNIGIEIKDKSVVGLKQNVFRRCHTAINMYKKNWRYGGGGILKADNTIYAVGCTANLKKDKHSKAEFNRIETRDPDLLVWRKTVSDAASNAPAIGG